MARKTPVLLRRGPLSGNINALLRYTTREVHGRELLTAHDKQDVTADFDALVMEILFGDGHDGPACPDIVYLLDKCAAGEQLDVHEASQMDGFHMRFKRLVERHNARLEASTDADQDALGMDCFGPIHDGRDGSIEADANDPWCNQ